VAAHGNFDRHIDRGAACLRAVGPARAPAPGARMTLEVDIEHGLGTFGLAVGFAAEGGLTALFGRSGSGKTSLINAIAGLIRPDRGRIVVDGVTVVATERGVFVPMHQRRFGYVFQDGRLFPHLTVRQNLLYGCWFVGKTE